MTKTEKSEVVCCPPSEIDYFFNFISGLIYVVKIKIFLQEGLSSVPKQLTPEELEKKKKKEEKV